MRSSGSFAHIAERVSELERRQAELKASLSTLDSQISAAEHAQMREDEPDRQKLTVYIGDLYRDRGQVMYDLGRVDASLDDLRLLQKEREATRDKEEWQKHSGSRSQGLEWAFDEHDRDEHEFGREPENERSR